MTVADMLDELSQHGFGDTDLSQKLRVLNATNWDIVGREKWPFREKSVALNFDGVSPTPTNIPADFRSVTWLTDTTTGEAVWPERVETIRDRYSNNMSIVQDPAFNFYFVGSQIRFYPVPHASTGRYLLDYVARQTILTEVSLETDILLPPEYHRAITLGALYKLYLMDDDSEQVPLFQADYENVLSQMREELFRRQYMRPDQLYVVDEGDEWYTSPFFN